MCKGVFYHMLLHLLDFPEGSSLLSEARQYVQDILVCVSHYHVFTAEIITNIYTTIYKLRFKQRNIFGGKKNEKYKIYNTLVD